MNVSVLVPWRPGCPWRERSWDWVQARYAERPYEVVTGGCPDGPFNRAAAILDAARRSSGDILVVADSDVWCDPAEAIDHASRRGWAVPHTLIHRLSPESTEAVLTGAPWRGLPLSTDNRQDSRPYRGKETGTLVVLHRDILDEVPPDPRFVGWGQEDLAWGAALNVLIGPPWRGKDDLVHLWHPAQPRATRAVGNRESYALWRRYAAAKHDRPAMQRLLTEARGVSV